MNIFFVDDNPIVAAEQLCDKHVVKMCLETAQILCSVSWRHGVPAPYKLTHKNHPITLWAGETFANWAWTVLHGIGLSDEYHRRYGKIHKSKSKIEWCMHNGGRPTNGVLTRPPLCMPDQYKMDGYVESYRNYYLGDKARFAKWKLNNVPEWYVTEAERL